VPTFRLVSTKEGERASFFFLTSSLRRKKKEEETRHYGKKEGGGVGRGVSFIINCLPRGGKKKEKEVGRAGDGRREGRGVSIFFSKYRQKGKKVSMPRTRRPCLGGRRKRKRWSNFRPNALGDRKGGEKDGPFLELKEKREKPFINS